MPNALTCPSMDLYKRLAAGELDRREKDSLLEHLEACEECAQKVASIPSEDSTLLNLLHRADTISNGPPAKEVAALVERLRQLKPASTSATSAPLADSNQATTLHAPVAPGTFSLVCPSCGKKLKVKESAVGKTLKCPACKQMVRVPGDQIFETQAPANNMPSVALKPMEDKTFYQRGLEKSQEFDFLSAPQMPDEIGRLGPYRVRYVLSSGGMGVVFMAEDPKLQRAIALKAVLPRVASNPEAKERFLREATAVAAIKHDHIITIYHVDEERGVPFIAMELLEGESLDKRQLREGKLPAKEVMRIGREIAEGLAAAHERGLIHRDIKPANVWLEGARARVKIIDFGLARSNKEDSNLTQSGTIIGTPAYMAPEQATGKHVDARCDLFSLGCLLYKITGGTLPFEGADPLSTLMEIVTKEPKPLNEVDPSAPQPLCDLVMKLLAKNPDDRPQTARAVADAIAAIELKKRPRALATQKIVRVQRDEPTEVASEPAAAPRRKKSKKEIANRTPMIAAAVFALIVVSAGATWVGMTLTSRSTGVVAPVKTETKETVESTLRTDDHKNAAVVDPIRKVDVADTGKKADVARGFPPPGGDDPGPFKGQKGKGEFAKGPPDEDFPPPTKKGGMKKGGFGPKGPGDKFGGPPEGEMRPDGPPPGPGEYPPPPPPKKGFKKGPGGRGGPPEE